jgi:hypothetical protein
LLFAIGPLVLQANSPEAIGTNEPGAASAHFGKTISIFMNEISGPEVPRQQGALWPR